MSVSPGSNGLPSAPLTVAPAAYNLGSATLIHTITEPAAGGSLALRGGPNDGALLPFLPLAGSAVSLAASLASADLSLFGGLTITRVGATVTITAGDYPVLVNLPGLPVVGVLLGAGGGALTVGPSALGSGALSPVTVAPSGNGAVGSALAAQLPSSFDAPASGVTVGPIFADPSPTDPPSTSTGTATVLPTATAEFARRLGVLEEMAANGADYVVATYETLPTESNTSGRAEFALVYNDDDEEENGQYFREQGVAGWSPVAGSLAGRVLSIEGGSAARREFSAIGIEDFDASLSDVYPLVSDADGAAALALRLANGKLLADLDPLTLAAAGLYGFGESVEVYGDIHVDGVGLALVDADNQMMVLVTDAGTEALEVATVPVQPLAEVLHFEGFGQSLSVGANARPALSTSQPYANLTFSGGPRSGDAASGHLAGLKALVEDNVAPSPDGGSDRGETPCAGMANGFVRLIAQENGVTSEAQSSVVLAATAGDGGEPIDNLITGAPIHDGRFRDHIDAGFARANELGKSYQLGALYFVQGEADQFSIAAGITRENYTTKFLQLRTDTEAYVQGLTKVERPVLMLAPQMTWHTTDTTAPVTLAQYDAMQADEHVTLVCTTSILPHSADGVHLSNIGSLLLGSYLARAAKRILYDGVAWQPLHPTEVIRQGRMVRIRHHVPAGSLVFDETTFPLLTDRGYLLSDGSGAVGIASMRIVNDSEVELVASRDFGPDPVVRYGLDYTTAAYGADASGGGNLRDSDTTPSGVASWPYLRNWCLSYELNL